MSQQILSNMNAIITRLDRLEQANEALAARIGKLETAATPRSPIVTEDGPNGPVIRRGRPPSAAAPDGTN